MFWGLYSRSTANEADITYLYNIVREFCLKAGQYHKKDTFSLGEVVICLLLSSGYTA